MNIKFRVCLWKIPIKKKYYLLEPIILKFRKRKKNNLINFTAQIILKKIKRIIVL